MQAPSVVATSAAPPPLSGSVEHSPPLSGGEEMPVSARLDDDLHLIRSEFQEIPDLRVNLEQAQVRWNLEPSDLELILETFVDVGFLRHSSDGPYYRR